MLKCLFLVNGDGVRVSSFYMPGVIKIHRNDYSALCDLKEDIFGVAALWNRRPWPAAMM